MATRAVEWLFLAITGLVVGMMLGQMTVGGWRSEVLRPSPAFSDLSANPDAAALQVNEAAPCLDCPDSYGVAARVRIDRDDRMSPAFRELGTVDGRPIIVADDRIDDYRYGGRFTDGEPQFHREKRTQDADELVAELDAPFSERQAPDFIY